MNNRKFGAFSSVEDPQKFSQTWASIFGIIGTILTSLAALKGIDATVANEQVKAIVDSFTLITTAGITIYQGSQAMVGAVRKVAAWFSRG